LQSHLRYPADRRQRLATEAQRADAEQVVGVAELAGRVAGECQRQVVRLDAPAIIDDADQVGAAVLDLDVDPPRAGIDAILEQLLDDAGRPFDHLAGGDLADDQ
jgi:hypothetical protein